MSSITIRPGVFVHIKTSITGGNTTYSRTDLPVSADPVEESGEPALVEVDGKKVKAKKRKWITDSVTLDVEEAQRASEVRSMACGLINSVTYQTALGRTCRREDEPTLQAMIAKAVEMVDNFNATATLTHIGFYARPIHLEADDTQAMKMITQELSDMLKQMDTEITAFNPKKIREIATRAQDAAAALDSSTQEKVQAAVDQARKAASTIAKRIVKDGEDKAKVLQDIQRGLIEKARVSFLDMSDVGNEEAMPVVAAQRIADLDLSDDAPAANTVEHAARNLDLSGSDNETLAASNGVSARSLDLL